MRPTRKIEPGSKVTIEVEAEDLWGGEFTFRVYGYPAVVRTPVDSPQIVKVVPPKKYKPPRDVPD